MTAAHPLSEQCPATSKRTGNRCQQNVIGGGPCRMHGGAAKQVAAAREVRIITAEAARTAPRTAAEAADVLLGAMNDSHSILQRLKENIASGQVSAADLDALGAWVDRAARTAKLVVDSGLDERKVRVAEGQGELLAQVVQHILGDLLASMLGLFAGDRVVTDRIQAHWGAAVSEIAPRRFREAGELEAGS